MTDEKKHLPDRGNLVKVVISELVWPEVLAALREVDDLVVDDLWRQEAALRAHLAEADGLIVRVQTRVTRELLAAAPRLKVVGRMGVGLDNVDLAAARERGIKVVFPRGGNAVTVAEYVFAGMLAAARRLAEATADIRAGGWDRPRFTGTELYGKTLGIVGLGDIGSRLAHRARAFGLCVLASDPLVGESALPVTEFGVRLVDLDTLLGNSDFVSLHVPFLPETRYLIDEARLARMKPTAWLINAARGGIVDEAALHRALKAGRLAGAVVDVREQEPPGAGDPLAALPNVILSPHVAGLTVEAQARTAELVAADVLRVLRGERPLNSAT